MCTRFYIEPHSALQPIIEKAQHSSLANQMNVSLAKPLTMVGELRPTDAATVIAPNKQGKPAVFPMLWGFSHEATSAPIVNCRIETASQKTMWKDSWFRRRCIIPASWYFEWEHHIVNGKKQTGTKYAIQPQGSELTYLAGLYRFEERKGIQIPVFAVLTREPSESVKGLHDRMPVIFSRADIGSWVKPDGNPEAVSRQALMEMCVEKAVCESRSSSSTDC